MIRLLDTDTLIFLVRGLRIDRARSGKEQRSVALAQRILERCRTAQSSGHRIGLSALSVAELEYGLRKCGNPERESSAMRKILVPFEVFDFDGVHAAHHYGIVRQELEASGTPIGSMDLLNGAHARALGAVLVTHNMAHFSRVPGLVCEDWTLDSAPSGSA